MKQMKHIKLFENYDKYDFKKYEKGQHDLDVLWDSVYKDVVLLSKDDFDFIKQNTSMQIEYISNPLPEKSRARYRGLGYVYMIFYLGDYCYCLVTKEGTNSKILSIEIFDDSDSLIDELEIINTKQDGLFDLINKL